MDMLMAEESMVREEVGKATAVAVREMVVVEMAKGALVMVTAVVVKAWVATDLAVASKVLAMAGVKALVVRVSTQAVHHHSSQGTTSPALLFALVS